MNADEVLVLGAGIIGLTTAIVLAEAGHRVRIWAADPPAQTTSRVAGAIWKPYLSQGPEVVDWAAASFSILADHATRPGTGVRMLPLLEAAVEPFELPDWAAIAGARRLGVDELLPGWTGGFHAVVPVVDTARYLPYLVDRLTTAGGRVEARRVGSFTSIGPRPIVINCTGLGARHLAGDQSLYPIRGQIVVLTNPGLDFCVGDTTSGGVDTYVIAHEDTVVVGGTADANQWALDPDPVTAAAMLERACRLVPELAGSPVVAHRVGLRPCRAAVRLEVDPVPPPGIGLLIHDYGHGGSGVTLSWGCAMAAAALVAGGQAGV